MSRTPLYIAVDAIADERGSVYPIGVFLPDGSELAVDAVLQAAPMRLVRDGEELEGTRYTVIVGGGTRYLFSDSRRWFIEVPGGATDAPPPAPPRAPMSAPPRTSPHSAPPAPLSAPRKPVGDAETSARGGAWDECRDVPPSPPDTCMPRHPGNACRADCPVGNGCAWRAWDGGK